MKKFLFLLICSSLIVQASDNTAQPKKATEVEAKRAQQIQHQQPPADKRRPAQKAAKGQAAYDVSKDWFAQEWAKSYIRHNYCMHG